MSLALLALVLGAMCLPAASIYAWQRSQPSPQDEVLRKALDHLYASPTYGFDGVRDSLKVTEFIQAMNLTPPNFWIVKVEFDCSHGGYGDRSGQVVTQLIQHHSALIHVTEGRVTLMIIDGVWDELAGDMI